MGEEVDLEEIAEKIFSVDPQPKFSIQIQLENSNIKELFEAMLMLTTHGMKKIFGSSEGKVNLSELTKKDIKYFNQYFQSFGMLINIEIENYNLEKDYESIKYNKIRLKSNTPLTDLKFPMLQPNGLVYIISFDYYKDYS